MNNATISILVLGLWGCAATVAAEPQPSPRALEYRRILKRLESAYGGASLKSLRTVSIESDRRLAWEGQGYTARFVEFATDRLHKHLDLVGQRGSVERWIRQSGNVYHDRYVLNGDGAYRLDYGMMTSSSVPSRGFYSDFAGDFRICDLLLAKRIFEGTAKVDYRGIEAYRGTRHAILHVNLAEKSEALRVFVEQDSGLITRVEFERPFGVVNLVFAGHRSSDGLTFAQENRAYIGDRLVEYENDLRMTFNGALGKHFEVEKLEPAPKMIDTSKMTVERVAPRVFFAGKDDYSLFVEHGGRYIAVSGYSGLKARAAALASHTGRPAKISHVVFTNHHGDQLAGIEDAIALGAGVYVTNEAAATLKADGRLGDRRPRILHDGDRIGPLAVTVEATAHAKENAFVFHKDSGVLFQDGHYHGLFEGEDSRAQPTAVALHDILTSHRLPVKLLVSGHGRKVERWEVFEKAVARYRKNAACPSRRRICRDE